MTYIELIRKADYQLDYGEITLGEYEQMIEPLKREIQPERTEERMETHAFDLISRQDAIDAIDVLCQEHRYKIPGKRETYSQYSEAWQDALDRAEGAIFNLPSAQLERKKGRWVKHGTGHSIYYDCSLCGCVAPCTEVGDSFIWKLSTYCPDCGAKMGNDGKRLRTVEVKKNDF